MKGENALAPAVVMGLSPTGLHVVRTLGREGVEVHGVSEGNQSGRLSRYLSSVVEDTGDRSLLAHLDALSSTFAKRGLPRAVIIPTSDQHVDFVIRHSATLTERFLFQQSYRDDSARRIMAKDKFYALCEQEGIRYPRLIEAFRDDLTALPGRLDFPWIIKPAQIHRVKREMRGKKGWIIRNEQELTGIISRIPRNAGKLLVQHIVPGAESEITLCCAYFDSAGAARQLFTARKLRQYPPGFGSASLVQSHGEPESARIVSRIVAAAGYRGVACGELKRDPVTGELSIIEINARPSLWCSVTDPAGRPVVLEAYRDMAGLKPTPDRPQQQGIRWKYALKDNLSALLYRVAPRGVLPPPDIGCCGQPRRSVYAVYAHDDPWPAIGEVIYMIRKAIARNATSMNGE